MDCWNCGSKDFIVIDPIDQERIEYCPDCSIKCDYLTGEANDLYNEAIYRRQIEDDYEIYDED